MLRAPDIVIVPLAVSLLALPCCRRDTESVSTAAGSAHRRPNIILLTVDTLRADHMALYGHMRNTMPTMEDFAKTAVVFDNAVVPRGSTRPSYASMLTGLHPYRHGVHHPQTMLHTDLVTLPEILRSAGYNTVAFISNFIMVGQLSGLNQGFDLYDDSFKAYRHDSLDAERCERIAGDTVKAILKWLNSDPRQPFFLFINLIDPHGPYQPPERFRSLYRSTKVRILDRDKIPGYLRVAGQLNYHDYVDRYDAEIRYADEALSVLVDGLVKRGLWDDSLVVFTADHGESLGEHGIFFEHHYHVWEETVHVPLAIRLPRSAGGSVESAGRPATAGPRRIRGVCSPMDLPPTILAYLDLPCEVDFDGRNLLPCMAGNDSDDDRMLFLEYPRVRGPSAYAVRTTTHKLMKVLEPTTGKVLEQAVFNLVDDPLEQRVIAFDPQNPLHRKLDDRFNTKLAQVNSYKLPFKLSFNWVPLEDRRGFVEQMRQTDKTNAKVLTEDQIKRMRGLGYVQ